ncbi:MAG TPA: FAD:protein FMN transferase [Longimicrobiales bacterium]|nr:FAD:protein FMN transferase [Longimicrobiales bacterium]
MPAAGVGSEPRSLEVRRAWPVMGTLLEVAAEHADPGLALAAVRSARAAVEAVDSLMSNYRPDSEISRLNASAGSARPTPISAWTADVLRAALAWGDTSGGAFDVTLGPVVDAWGFYRERGAVPEEAVLDSVARLAGQGGLAVGARAARLERAGMRVDLGAIAKGFAVDRALEVLARAGVVRAMVDLGGSVAVLGDPPAGVAWPIGIRDPRHAERVAAVLHLPPGSATATSGDYERFFEVDGVRYAHIIDPRTNRPARGVASVSVIAPSALEADVLSTTLYLLGPARGACLLADRHGTAALWFLDDGGGGPAVGADLPALVAGAAAAAFEPAGESPGDSGVGRAERNPRAYTRARCDTEG